MSRGAYERGLKQTIDWGLVITYLLLVIIGWVNIYAASHGTDSGPALSFSMRSGKQFVWILTSLALAGIIVFILNARLWEVLSVPGYVFVFFLLVLVIFVSKDVKGSHSWFELGPVKFQPAEISKITTSLVLAAVMSRPGFKMSKFKDFCLMAAVIGLPMLAILAESETGSALVYIGFIFVLYREGFSGWFIACIGLAIVVFIATLTKSPFTATYLLVALVSICYSFTVREPGKWFKVMLPILFVSAFLPMVWNRFGGEEPTGFWAKVTPMRIITTAVLASVPVLMVKAFREKRFALWASVLAMLAGLVLVFSTEFIFNDVLQDHQRKRIEVLLGLKEDPSGVGYNVNQSMIAIGSGGLFGKGFLNGTQTTYGFVPEQSTDFIFCTVGEEWGFIGCLVVILLYVFMISRLIIDAEKSREAFTRIYGYCVASLIFMHLFINIGMTIGLMPVIGIPLPLLSYGGSSLWAFTILIFIFIALHKQESKYF